MAKAPLDIRSLARQHTSLAINQLARICGHGESESARVMAANALLDRGWGKAPATLAGAHGEGAIEVVIRHILDHPRDEVLVVEHVPTDTGDT